MSDQIKRLPVYLSLQEHKELKSFCSRLGLSMSFFANLAIRDKIKKELDKLRKGKLNGK